jgi:imidazolonepropionase-like amidohydrolase
MVKYGMSEMKAIKAATINTAELLNIDSSLGSIEVGKIADLVAVNNSPLNDISTMKDVTFVMKEGEVIKND